MNIKWKMIDSKKFVATYEDYELTVTPSGVGKYWYWSITKDGDKIDNAIHHSPTSDELSAKVQAERELKKIIEG